MTHQLMSRAGLPRSRALRRSAARGRCPRGFSDRFSGWGIPAAGTIVPAAAALRVHILSPQCCTNHRPGTADSALHFDSLHRTVLRTGPALHAGRGPGQDDMLPAFGKDRVRADLQAAFAVDAAICMQFQRCFSIRVEERLVPLFSSSSFSSLSSSEIEHVRSPRGAGSRQG